MSTPHNSHNPYYLPPPSFWPLIGSIGLFTMLFGAANWLHDKTFGMVMFFIGGSVLIFMMFGWFSMVIRENRQGLNNDPEVDRSFRWGMVWFIFSEVCFFGAFFGALIYSRLFSVTYLGGTDVNGLLTHYLLWPNFKAAWPVLQNPDPSQFTAPKAVMETWGIPALNTLILLSSGVTITIAHWALANKRRTTLIIFQIFTILLGITFLSMQAHEYGIAYMEKGLKLSSGIYGSTFFMMTGFHALHVTIGTICLIVILWRILKNQLSPTNQFSFEAVSWYWHFVDVVWLGLFILVYWW